VDAERGGPEAEGCQPGLIAIQTAAGDQAIMLRLRTARSILFQAR
jgi:hypothetical protein